MTRCALRSRARLGQRAAFAVLVLGLTWSTGARAISAFAREGLGEWLEGYDVRGEALGSTGIGVPDPFNFCMANPAASAFSSHALVHLGLDGTVNRVEDRDHAARRGSGTLRGMGVFVPIAGPWGMRWTLRPYTDGAYAVREIVATGSGDPGNVRVSEGARGLLLVSGEATYRHGHSFAAGLSAGLTAGSMIDEVSYEFADSGWADTQDQRKLRVKPAWVFGGGLLWAPTVRVAVGASASIGTRMTAEDELHSPGGAVTTRQTTTVDPPLGLGGGLSLRVHERLRVSADLYWRGWEDVQVGGLELPQHRLGPFRNTLRWGLGVERTPQLSPISTFWNQLSWRAGFAWIPWYAEDLDGHVAEERRISVGVGIPIRVDRGTLDFTVSWGRRGSLGETGIAEEYLRFAFGTTFARMVREY